MLRNVYVTYVSFLPIYSSDEYAGIVIFSTTTILGFGVLLVARIVRLRPIQAERLIACRTVFTDASSRCLSAMLW